AHQESARPEYKTHRPHALQGTCFEPAHKGIEGARQDEGAQDDNEDGRHLAEHPECDPGEYKGNDTLRRYFKSYEAGQPFGFLRFAHLGSFISLCQVSPLPNEGQAPLRRRVGAVKTCSWPRQPSSGPFSFSATANRSCRQQTVRP